MKTQCNRLLWFGSVIAVLAVMTFTTNVQSMGNESSRPGSDIAVIAAAKGITQAEAARRLDLQRDIGKLEATLMEVAEDIFAGLWIEHEPDFAVEVRFTNTLLGGAMVDQLSRELAGEVKFRVDRFDASLRELEALQEKVVLEARMAKIDVDSDINIRANHVELMTTDLPALEASLDTLRVQHAETLQLIAVDALAYPEQPLRGGRPLSTCSTGFTVRHNSTGQVGVLTAAHCGNSQTYLDTGQSLPFRSEKQSGSEDVQWHSRACNMTVPNEFDSGMGIRTVDGTVHRNQQPIGAIVCRHGKTTPYRCGKIKAKNVCPSFVQSCSSTFIRVEPILGQPTPLSAGGDSGGPWFVENFAYGIHTGGFSNSPDKFYMAINYASALGVTVLTHNGHTGAAPSASVNCWNNFVGASQIDCWASSSGGGVAPYTYQWSYWGDAPQWGSSFSQAWADYSSVNGCPSNGFNYFSVQITDSCGQSGWGSAQADCPACDDPFSCPIY